MEHGPRRRWRFASAFLAVGFLIGVVGGLAVLVASRAPSTITLATGAPGGAYHALGTRLRDAVASRGFDLRLLETDGSVDNVRAIQDGRADLALVQSGTEEIVDVAGFSAIAELFYEPIWIWYRTDRITEFDSLAALGSRPVAVGTPGSGAYAVATKLLALHDVADVERVEASATDTLALLQAGVVDAGFVVAGADAPVIADLAATPDLAPHLYKDAEGHARRLPYLSAVPISRGVLDLPRVVPATDGTLLAARATLVGEPGLHPDVARLLVTVLPEVLAHPLVGEIDAFPSLARTNFPVNDDARRFLDEGPTPLEGVLPFWLASPLARTYVILLPLLVLAWPLWQVVKAAYGWYMKSRIVGWYPRLLAIERGLPESTLPQLRLQRRFLDAVVDSLARRTRVSAGYLSAYYDLRGHIDWIRGRLDARIEELEAAGGGGVQRDDDAGEGVDPTGFSDEAMGIDDDLRELRGPDSSGGRRI